MTTQVPNRWVSRLPWWVSVLLGLACAALGAFLVFRPFASLSVLIAVVSVGMFLTGVATLAAARRIGGGWPAKLAGIGWVIAGVAVIVWPDLSTRGLAIVVGVAMIVGGLLDVIGGLTGSADERIASVIGGLASAIFGVLALTWPDVTVLVVAVVFGARLVLAGLRLAWSSYRNRDGGRDAADVRPRGKVRRFAHVVGTTVALVLALLLAGVSAKINTAEPVVDAFYDTPDEVPAEPGQLLSVEEFDRAIPDQAQAWRILYTTTRDEGQPAVASAIVVVPRQRSTQPPAVIAWAHGTTGVARKCAPSVLPDPWAAGAFFSLDRVIDEGWALVATDYVGLGTESPHPYLIGQGEGRSVLDAVRAAHQMEAASLGDQTVVWGHSQGGGAALWTGILAPRYAPDVDVVGVAALAPASNLIGLIDHLGDVTGGSLFASYVVDAYADVYPDVDLDDYVRPAGRTTFEETAGRCLNASAIVSALSSITTGMSMFEDDLDRGALHDRLEQNIPTGPIEAPLLLAQGAADSLVIPAAQDDYVAARCASGQDVDYRKYEGRDHVPLVQADSPLIPELIQWTHDRLDGRPPTPNCPAG
jgi:uncharacterized membrane protein HdeD (DUF308 family)